MIDRGFIGHEFAAFTVEVERGRLRLFAKAIAEPASLFRSSEAAQAAGYPDLPIPPTYLFCLEMDREEPFDFLALLGVEVPRILHGEQSFTYHAPIFAGERITFRSRIADVFDKRGGELEFLILDTSACKANGSLAAEMRRTIVIRNGAQNG